MAEDQPKPVKRTIAPAIPKARTATPSAPSRAKPRKMVGRRHGGGAHRLYPWEKIQVQFVEQVDPIKLKDLADVWNVPYDQLRDKSSKGRWPFLRVEHQMKLSELHARKRIKTQLENAQNFDEQSLHAAKMGHTLIAGRLSQIASLFAAQQAAYADAVARLKAGLPVDRSELYSAVNYKELNELASALERFQAVGRRALGTDFLPDKAATLDSRNEELDLDITEEIQKPDLDRLAAFFEAAQRAGLNDMFALEGPSSDDSDIVDAEVVPE